MPETLDTETLYPRTRAFLIRFQRDADLRTGRLAGKVEQVTDFGLAQTFSSLPELLALLDEKLAQTGDRLP